MLSVEAKINVKNEVCVKYQVPKRVDDKSSNEEHDGKDDKNEITQFVVLAVFGQLRKLPQNTHTHFNTTTCWYIIIIKEYF